MTRDVAYDFTVIEQYWARFLNGVALTIAVALVAFTLSLPIGLGLAFARRNGRWASKALATTFIEVFRNIPLLLVLYALFYGLGDLRISIGAIAAGTIGMILNASAYVAEIFRGALGAIATGQYHAAASLGLGSIHTLTFVVLPQVFRIAYPALGNILVACVLGSSFVSVIGVPELTHTANLVGSITFRYIEVYVFAAVMYIILAQVIRHVWNRAGRALLRGEAV